MGKQQNEWRKLDDCDDNDEFYLLEWMIKIKKLGEWKMSRPVIPEKIKIHKYGLLRAKTCIWLVEKVVWVSTSITEWNKAK